VLEPEPRGFDPAAVGGRLIREIEHHKIHSA